MRSLHRVSPAALIAAGAVAFLLASNGTARAQTPYVVADSVGTYSEITGGSTYTPVAYSFFSAWDEGDAAITLPFTFTWYGNNYTTLYAYTNGFVSFNAPPAGAGLLGPPSIVPSTANVMHNFIGVMWSDLEGPPGAEIRAETSGAMGARVFTIQYKNFRDFGNMLSTVNFQVKLYEGTSAVEVVMGDNTQVTGGATAIENQTGSDGMNLLASSPTCGAGCACSPGACGSMNWQPRGRTFTITLPAGPELTGEISGPRGAYPNTTFDALIRIRNLGLSDTGPFSYDVRLSNSNTSTIGSVLLERVSLPGGVAASSTYEVTRTLTMPAGQPAGTFYLALDLDVLDEVSEVIETNNAAFDPRGIATAPDLSGAVQTPNASGPGEPLAVRIAVASNGAPVTSPILVSFHLSEDMVLDGSDLPLGTAMITLPDGFSDIETVSLNVPANAPVSPPSYWVLAVIDDQNAVPETNESNNLAISIAPMLLNPPDLSLSAIDSADFAFRGLSFPVTTSVENTGGATAHDFTVCVVISRNQLISVISDPILVETAPMTLRPGETASLSLSPPIDAQTSTGAWYLATVADCAGTVMESLETNNTRRRMEQIVVRDPAPDFTVAAITTATAAAAGETIPVSARIANLGNVAGDVVVRLVVSDNPGISLSDQTIYETMTPLHLAPSAEQTIAVWASLPGVLASGAYYIGAIVDPANTTDEVYEDNNGAGAGPVIVTGSDLAIVTPQPPPAVIGVPYVRRFSAVGGSATYVWSITWENGRAPDGLSFDTAAGELNGTPTAAAEGRYSFDVSVTSGAQIATRTYSLIVTQPTIPLSIVSSRLPPGLAAERYSVQLIAVGGTPPYHWTLSGDMPLGLSLGLSDSGELGGEPQHEGAYTFGVDVEDLAGVSVHAILAIDVVNANVAVSITTADVPRADLDVPYETTFTVSGGTPPYTWRFDRESPIPGLEFMAENALLTGTPTVAGDYPFVIEVRDSKGLIDRNAYVLSVLPPGDLVITTGQTPDAQLPAGKVGVAYADKNGAQVQLRVVRRAGGPLDGITWTVVDGMLPPGIVVDPSGLVSGTPTGEGKFPFRVLVTSAQSDFAFAALVIEVQAADMTNMPGAGSSGCSCSTTDEAAGSSPWLALGLLAVLGLVRRRRRAASIAIAALTLPSASASAQVVPYVIAQSTEPYAELTGATRITPGLADGNTATVMLPFDFNLYGTLVDTLYVNANGLVAIDNIHAGHHFPPFSLPDPSITGWIGGLWDDWCSSRDCGGITLNDAGVYYLIDSTPGAGKITIEYRHIRHYSDFGSPSDLNFQIVLYEGVSQRIDLHYGPMTQGTDFSGSPTNFHARIGLEDLAATNAMWLAPCAGIMACTFADISTLTDQKLTLLADAGEDVAVSSVSVPAVGYPGLPLPITARLISRHQEPLGPITFAAYLISATETSTAGALQIYSSAPATLGGFESRLLSFDGEVPQNLPIGQYRVVVMADDHHQLAETDESNNLEASIQTVRIADRAPDFRVIAVRPLEQQLSPGGTLHVAYRVDNGGNEPGHMSVQPYLSANQAITTRDLPLGPPLSFDTTARQVFTGTISAPLAASISTGAYYVGFIADPDLAVPELSESNNVGRAPGAITISSSTVEIITSELPAATIGLSYSATVRAAGGSGTFTYRLSSGMLPRGMSFNAATAEVFGIPLEAGSFMITFEARSGTLTARRMMTLEVLDPTLPLTIVSGALPPAVLGQDYAVTVRAIGGVEPYAWSVVNGELPAGLVLASDGTVLGTPEKAGFSSFDLQLRDNAASTSSVTLSIEVRTPGNLTIVSSELPQARLGEDYFATLFAAGGVAPIRWSAVTTGTREMDVPPGLVVGDDGTISGVPEIAGAYHFHVQADDSATNSDTNLIAIEVVAVGHFDIATAALPDGVPGDAYRAVIKGEGGATPYTWEVRQGEGSLPPGFQAAPGQDMGAGETMNDLVISGALEREGTWTFTVRLHDAQGRVVDRPFAIVSRLPLEEVPTPVMNSGCSCSTSPSASRAHALWPSVLVGLLSLSLRPARRRFFS